MNPVMDVEDSEVVSPLKKVMRKATAEDLLQVQENKKKPQKHIRFVLKK